MTKDVEIKQTLDALSDVVRELRVANGSSPNTSNIMINGGSVGVWIATVCCALMLGISIVGATVIIDQSRQISDLRDYLSAIYAQAPQLQQPPSED
ncbi:MAG: hypothetical protein E6Q97_09415 [Desulfurellales bacterium]|nr:MAG: hypothetical protein E6Q97_09415 [Desulfurellales bacterium]